MKGEVIYTRAIPTASEFNTLRHLMGWVCMEGKITATSLQNSQCCICARYGGELVGVARVVGDGVMYYYIQDVMVHPDWQGKGIGKHLMTLIEEWLQSTVKSGATVALLSAKGKEDFYQKFNYQIRPSSHLGAGMSRFIK